MSFLRSLLKSPLPSLLAVLALALGLGSASALGSLLDRLILQAVPFQDPATLVQLYRVFPEFNRGQFNGHHVQALMSESGPFEAVAAVAPGSVSVEGPEGPRPVPVMRATGDGLPLLKVKPHLGRLGFTPEETSPGGPAVVVLSHGLWRDRFGADPTLVGRSVVLGGRDRTVVGVLPADFTAPSLWLGRPQAVLPLVFTAEELKPNAGVNYEVLGRLKPGMTPAKAKAWCDGFARTHFQGQAGLRCAPLSEARTRPYLERMSLLTWAVALMLLVACANAGGLLLARQGERHGVLVLQGVLGASPWRLGSQVALEGLGFGLMGAFLGLVLEAPLRAFLASQMGLDTPPRPLWVLGAAPVLGLLTGLAASALPAWRSARTQPIEALRGLDRKNSPRSGARKALVAGELALSFVLLAAAGAMLASLWSQVRQGTGFEVRQLSRTKVDIPPERQAMASAWARTLAMRLQELPGMESAAICLPVPIAAPGGSGHVNAVGGTVEIETWHHWVEGPIAHTLGVSLVAGRDLRVGEEGVALVSEPLARGLWPEGQALGRQVDFDGKAVTVVGVVSGTREGSLDEPLRSQIYLPIPPSQALPFLHVLLRSKADPVTLDTQVRAAVRGTDASLAMGRVRPLSDAVASLTQGLSRAALPLGLLAGVSALLAALGTVGLVSHLFRMRQGELGIRSALGATPGGLAWLVFSQGGRLLLAGLSAGLLGGAALGWVLRAQVSGLKALTFGAPLAAALLLAATTLLACVLPALRAARTAPARALRAE